MSGGSYTVSMGESPSERAGPKPEPIGRCADCGSHETPVGEYPLTSCISCGAPWRNYAREERAGERELREALEEIAAFGCGWDRGNVNPCTKRYASRKEWCAPCIARRALLRSVARLDAEATIEVEQNDLLEEAKRKLEEAAGAFFDGNIYRAPDLAYAAYRKAVEVEDANPTREGIVTLVSRLAYITDALDHFVTTADRDV